ncbi:hypothetical protein DY000_02032703 [Brassica cretica]|uniref:Uncharacterized protein n=1 Tax=Brassica cretica TaxID=69181 RepID=A0ABQ7DJT6_BRACR|nr:hypothetical protein DY000_02032703 [Brassica cretica]
MPEIFRGCEPRNVDKRISLDEVSIVSKDRPPRPRARTVSTRVTLPMDEDDPHRGHLAHRRGRPAPRSPRPWARTTRTEVDDLARGVVDCFLQRKQRHVNGEHPPRMIINVRRRRVFGSLEEGNCENLEPSCA